MRVSGFRRLRTGTRARQNSIPGHIFEDTVVHDQEMSFTEVAKKIRTKENVRQVLYAQSAILSLAILAVAFAAYAAPTFLSQQQAQAKAVDVLKGDLMLDASSGKILRALLPFLE